MADLERLKEAASRYRMLTPTRGLPHEVAAGEELDRVLATVPSEEASRKVARQIELSKARHHVESEMAAVIAVETARKFCLPRDQLNVARDLLATVREATSAPEVWQIDDALKKLEDLR